MKKLLKVSLMAMLVASPLVADAADIAAATKETVTPTADVASTSYVKGAYNAAIDEINTNRTQINKNTTAIAGKQAQLTNGTANVSETVKTAVAATGSAVDTALVTEKAVRDAIDAATQSTTYQAGSGLALDSTTNTFSASGITTSNIAADAAIAKTQLATDVQTSLGLADTALQNDDLTSTYTASDTTKAVTGAAVASAIVDKADAATTLAGYGITDAYTKTETDGLLDAKADAATTLAGYGITDAYTKTETDGLLDAKANAADLGNKSNLSSTNFTEAERADVVTAVNAAMAQAKTASAAKKVTVHTTWGSDETTAPADVLVNAN